MTFRNGLVSIDPLPPSFINAHVAGGRTLHPSGVHAEDTEGRGHDAFGPRSRLLRGPAALSKPVFPQRIFTK